MHEVIEAYMKNLKDEKEKELAAVEEEAYLSTFLCCSHASGMGPNAMVAEAGTLTKEAQKLADELGVKIFVGDIIHEVIKAYMKNPKEEKEKELAAADKEAVFPCKLKILPKGVFHRKYPIIVRVKGLQGIKVGTPLCILQREDFVVIGRVETIKNRNRCVDMANK
ncbi:hypothetical protein ACLB2K_033465 [Fragaria x ananassa]